MLGKIIIFGSVLTISGCAALHHVQIGEIDNRDLWNKRRFEIKVSEIGASVTRAGKVARQLSGNEAANDIATIIQLFQLGPKTGLPVYREAYARKTLEQIMKACPSGRVSGLNSIRELREYYAISGEIVKITGYCLTPKVSSEKRRKRSKENIRT